jgi:hypothetical protein
MEELPFACDLQTVGKLHEVPFPIQQRRLQKASARHFSEKASDTLCNPMSKPRVENQPLPSPETSPPGTLADLQHSREHQNTPCQNKESEENMKKTIKSLSKNKACTQEGRETTFKRLRRSK